MIRHFALFISVLLSVLPFTAPLAAQDCTIAAGQAAFDAGDYAEAFDIFVCVDDSGEAEEQAALGIGRAALMLDEYSVAANAASWAAEAVGLSQREYGVQQIDRLTRALTKYPDSVPLMTQLAHWLWLRARDDEALPLYDAILSADSQSVFAHTFRASSQAYLGDLDAADADFAQAFELAPRNDHVYAIAAVTYLDTGDPQRAIDYASRAIALNPGDFPGRHVTRGDAYSDLGDYASAVTDYEEALAINPDNFDALTGLARAHLNTMDTEAGLEAINHALELEPESSWALTLRGHLYLNASENELAEADFVRALELRPDTVDALTGLGDATYNMGDYAAAAEHYQQALAVDPASRNGQSGLAASLVMLDDPEAGQAVLALFETAVNALELAAIGKPQVLPLDFDTVYVSELDASAGDTISATAESVEDNLLDLALIVLGPNGEVVAMGDSAAGDSAMLEGYTVAENGRHTVIIGLLDAVGGDVRLAVKLTPAG